MQSCAAPKSVPEAATMLMAHVPQRLWSRRSKFLLKQVDRVNNQIPRFEVWIIIWQLWTDYMQRSDDGPWLRQMAWSHKIRDSSIHEKSSFWTWKTLRKGVKPIGRVWIYKEIDMDVLHLWNSRHVGKEFTTMFKGWLWQDLIFHSDI